jgi:hypothetical protein
MVAAETTLESMELLAIYPIRLALIAQACCSTNYTHNTSSNNNNNNNNQNANKDNKDNDDFGLLQNIYSRVMKFLDPKPAQPKEKPRLKKQTSKHHNDNNNNNNDNTYESLNNCESYQTQAPNYIHYNNNPKHSYSSYSINNNTNNNSKKSPVKSPSGFGFLNPICSQYPTEFTENDVNSINLTELSNKLDSEHVINRYTSFSTSATKGTNSNYDNYENHGNLGNYGYSTVVTQNPIHSPPSYNNIYSYTNYDRAEDRSSPQTNASSPANFGSSSFSYNNSTSNCCQSPDYDHENSANNSAEYSHNNNNPLHLQPSITITYTNNNESIRLQNFKFPTQPNYDFLRKHNPRIPSQCSFFANLQSDSKRSSFVNFGRNSSSRLLLTPIRRVRSGRNWLIVEGGTGANL